MSIFEKHYTLGEIAKATATPEQSIKGYVHKRLIPFGEQSFVGGGGPGQRRGFSIYAVMQIAVAKALVDASGGMDIKTAFKAALVFSHEGVAPTPVGFVDDGFSDNEPERWAGQPYAEGETLLAAGNGTAAVIQRLPGDDAYTKAKAALGGTSGGVTGFVIIDAGEVFSRVSTALAR